jgi:hypothetical protein
MGIAGNEQVDVQAKTALEDTLQPTKRISPQDQSKWLTTKAKILQIEKWSTCNNEMREKKDKKEW